MAPMYSQNFTCSLLCNFAIILQEEAQLHVTNPLEDTEFQVKCQPVQLLRAASMLLPPTTGVANLELFFYKFSIALSCFKYLC